MKLKDNTSHPYCPKCGNTECIAYTYVPGGHVLNYLDASRSEVPEHMALTCLRCDFKWAMAVKESRVAAAKKKRDEENDQNDSD